MTDPLLAALASADPATGVDLSRIDDAAFAPLREGIPMTTTTTRGAPTSPAPRRRRRSVLVATLVASLVGAGAAAAAYQHWYAGGALDGLTCLTTWHDPGASDLDATGGPALTGDPIADCQRYQQEEGRPAIADPVAIEWHGRTVVAPRGEIPAGSDPLPAATSADARTRELRASLGDYVDGGSARCFTAATGKTFADKEITRLGLSGWTVRLMPAAAGGPCGFFDTDSATRTVMVFPDRGPDPDIAIDGDAAKVFALRDALRRGIADQCVSLAQAETVAAAALGSDQHWPLTSIEDPAASCARVDLEVGGSVQVTVYGR